MISIIHDIKIFIFLFTKLFNINKKYRLISKANNFYTRIYILLEYIIYQEYIYIYILFPTKIRRKRLISI